MWQKPTFVIDTKKVKQHIDKMQRKANANQVVFRPHFKTHQSAKVGQLFKESGITKIAVSSVSMAIFFAQHKWDDITIAFPVNLLEIDDINRLASDITLHLLVESNFSVQFLANHIKSEVGIFIKIDTGYHRTGILPNNYHEIKAIINIIQSTDKLVFKGFLTHSGHTYSTHSKDEIIEIYNSGIKQLSELKNTFIDDFPRSIISYGDTPSCSIVEDFGTLDEVRPGNFVYYDLMQAMIGSCTLENIAVAVACPVVATHAERNELIIYGGAVHLSKEFILDKNGQKNYGLLVEIDENGRGKPVPGAFVSSLSQEHGIVKVPGQLLSDLKPGHVIGILPVHSCLTANLLKENTILL